MPNRIAALVLAGVLAAAVAALFFFNPTVSRWLPPCPTHRLTGLYCPGCGATRALHALLHGQLGAAARLNAAVLVALPFIAFGLARRGARAAGLPLAPPAPLPRAVGVLVLAAVVLWGVARNLPFAPFSALAPH